MFGFMSSSEHVANPCGHTNRRSSSVCELSQHGVWYSARRNPAPSKSASIVIWNHSTGTSRPHEGHTMRPKLAPQSKNCGNCETFTLASTASGANSLIRMSARCNRSRSGTARGSAGISTIQLSAIALPKSECHRQTIITAVSDTANDEVGDIAVPSRRWVKTDASGNSRHWDHSLLQLSEFLKAKP